MIEIEVNNKIIEANKGEFLLSTLKRNGMHVPTLCHMKDLFPTGSCRMCVVEMEGMDNLVPACSYPVNEWMRIKTHSPRVVSARKMLVELLLSNHPDDCLYCIRNGNCELQKLAEELNVHERRFFGNRAKGKIDNSSPSVVHNPEKCILCGRCVRYCDEILQVSAIDFIGRGNSATIGTEFNHGLNLSTCIDCGQCIMVCPTGALHEKTSQNKIRQVIHDKTKHVVGFFDSGVAVSLAEEFGFKPGKNIEQLITTALRIIGFDKVYDSGFAGDLMINEMAHEWLTRIKNNKNLPLIATHCPSWVKYAERNYPELKEHFTAINPPQEIMGSIIKNYYAHKAGLNKENIYVVSLTTCTARKEERLRKNYTEHGISYVDTVMTTRELADFIKLHGIDLNQIEEELTDLPFGMSSTVGKMVASPGGLSEGIARTAFYKANNRELRPPRITKLRNNKARKEYRFRKNGHEYLMLAVHGLAEAKNVIKEMKQGHIYPDFIEILTCKEGCLNGGGQPLRMPEDYINYRRKAVYNIDNQGAIKTAHKNPEIEELYSKYLEAPGSEKSVKLLYNPELTDKK
ncbi:MAG: (2Fe-2S)-binding protein [Bacteroidales bacterium]|nr:(2Fe-2S)-binding protein [Bacteroidales bacterium]